MQIHSVVFAQSRQINKQKVCENNLFCPDNKVFLSSRGEVTPTPHAYALVLTNTPVCKIDSC